MLEPFQKTSGVRREGEAPAEPRLWEGEAPAEPRLTGRFALPLRLTGRFALPLRLTGRFALPLRLTGRFALPLPRLIVTNDRV